MKRCGRLATAGLLSGRAGVALAANAIRLDGDFSFPKTLPPESADGWAEGAIGVALAALQADRAASGPLDVLNDLAATPAAADDGFAFGTAGEADALIWAAARTGQPHLHQLALRRMAKTAERALCGAPRFLGGKLGEGLQMRGLLHGSAGVAYALLRLAAPDRLPALAVFELPPTRESP